MERRKTRTEVRFHCPCKRRMLVIDQELESQVVVARVCTGTRGRDWYVDDLPLGLVLGPDGPLDKRVAELKDHLTEDCDRPEVLTGKTNVMIRQAMRTVASKMVSVSRR